MKKVLLILAAILVVPTSLFYLGMLWQNGWDFDTTNSAIRTLWASLKFLDVLFLLVSVVLIILSLLQGGKSEGASGAITGAGMNVFVKTKERGSDLIISNLTLGFAIVFFFLALMLNALA